MKKQAIGRVIRSKEDFESYCKRLNSEFYEIRESMNKFGTSNIVCFKECKISETDLQRLLLEISVKDLFVRPLCDGFSPYYEICSIEGNPLMEYEVKTLVKIHSRQLPKNFQHQEMKKYFANKRNLELAELVKEKIRLDDSFYYY